MHDPRNRSGMRNVNYAFAFAEWVVMVNRNRSIYPADAVVVVFLFMGTVSLLSALEIFDRMRPWRARRADPFHGGGGEMARLLLLGAFIIWSVWWWFEGIHHTLQDCGTITFYYGGPVKIFGDFRLIGQIWSPLLLVMFIPVIEEFIVYMRDSYRRFRSRRHLLAEAKQLEARAQMATDPSTIEFWEQVFDFAQGSEEPIPLGIGLPPDTKQRRGLVCALVLGIAAFVLISFLEVMLAYGDVNLINAIGGVGDTIPMVIGCGDMLMIFYKLKQQSQRERKKVCYLVCPPIVHNRG